jgi:hypothetical protein
MRQQSDMKLLESCQIMPPRPLSLVQRTEVGGPAKILVKLRLRMWLLGMVSAAAIARAVASASARDVVTGVGWASRCCDAVQSVWMCSVR